MKSRKSRQNRKSFNPIILRLFCCFLETLNASKGGGRQTLKVTQYTYSGAHIEGAILNTLCSLLETPKIHTV